MAQCYATASENLGVTCTRLCWVIDRLGPATPGHNEASANAPFSASRGAERMQYFWHTQAHPVSLLRDMVLRMRLFERQDGRYYFIAEPHVDLLGDHVVVTCRGSRFSRLGGCKTFVGTDPIDLEQVIARIVKTRLRHGYAEILRLP